MLVAKWLWNPENRAVASFIGAGVAAVVVAGWTVFVYFQPRVPPQLSNPFETSATDASRKKCTNAIQYLMTTLRANLTNVRADQAPNESALVVASGYESACKPSECSGCGDLSFGNGKFTQQALGVLLEQYTQTYNSEHGCPAGTYHGFNLLTAPCIKPAPVPLHQPQ
jgi:hypothetical protein